MSLGLYSPFNPSHLFAVQCRERVALRLLAEAGVTDLAPLRILDVGCGDGTEMGRLSGYGARRLFGVELDHARAVRAGAVQGDATALPYRDASFDLALQFTMFSSLPNTSQRRLAAREILRVLKPGGHLLWHDFWCNPVNPLTHPLPRWEIRDLFPGCRIRFRRSTLAPPIARRLAGWAWHLTAMLEAVPWLRTHYVALVTR